MTGTPKIYLVVIFTFAIAIAVCGVSLLGLLAIVGLTSFLWFYRPGEMLKPRRSTTVNATVLREALEDLPEEVKDNEETNFSPVVELPKRFYRETEKKRAIASLLAGGSLLIAGEEGSGKSYLGDEISKTLINQGYNVVVIEPCSTKQLLLTIAEQLTIEPRDLSGKPLSIDGLKGAIEQYLIDNTTFFIVDDAHRLESKVRIWLKVLKKKKHSMLLLATDPPRTDVFLSVPPLILQPLPEYAIREMMEQAAIERGLSFKQHELAKLQHQAGGNPALAIRVIEQEYLGLTVEASDESRHYFDITPLLFLGSAVLVMCRFIAIGTHNPVLYVLFGSAGAMMLGISKTFQTLPKDSRRIT